MKKLTVLFTLIFVSFSFAQPLDGYKICIDPGHGGHDAANDRHIVEADFWESEGNFGKALHVEQILESFGAEVILTRYGNDDSDDIALSARAAIANQNNVDFFHSIHSNATGTSSRRNFVLIIFRGYTNDPKYPEAKDYARTVYRTISSNNHVENLGYDNLLGDLSGWWGTSGLGVLRPLNLPGVLSEGSFHDYLPEAWRLKNDDYLRHDAWAITRALMDHFNVDEPETGIVAGIVRDPAKNVPSSYQPISSLNDSKKPVNYINVRLEPGGMIYEGDNQNNGYYMFDELEPGNYKLYFETEYYEHDSADVVISANRSVFAYKNLNEIPDYNTPNILSIFPEDNTIDFSTRDTIEIMFDQRMDRTTTEQAFALSPGVSGKLFWREQDKKLMFFPTVPFDQETIYRVGIAASAKTIYDANLEQEFSSTFTTGTAAGSNVVSGSPADGSEGVSNIPEIILTFDTRMNTITTQNAFSITPDLNGSFSWNDGYDSLYFNASNPGTPGETYTVTLATSARNYYGGYLLDEFSFSFTTRSKLNLIDHYPHGGEADIANSVLVKLEFDMPIQSTTLPGNILFYDEQDNFIQVSVDQSAYANGFIEFEPSQPLELNSTYRVILKDGIGDVEGVTLDEEIIVEFTIENTTYEDGTVLDDFENSDTWQDPLLSSNTQGIDPELTEFSLTGTKRRSDLYSGLLEYTFSDSTGLIELAHLPQIDLGSDDNTELGVWVYGDYSSNTLEYWFEDNQSNLIKVEIDTVNWTGWKIKSVKLGEIDGSSPFKLNSIVIKQSESGKAEGKIYFDDVQVDFITPVTDIGINLPEEFSLLQNYPNPFNPSTNIKFTLPEISNVRLDIFNILGENIVTLIDNKQYQAGVWNVKWDSRNSYGQQVPTGIYLYKISTSKFTSVKKMMLMK